MSAIVDNLKRVNKKISEAAQRVSRDPEEIELVVVTKGVPLPLIEVAIKAGVTDIGENRAQEIIEKYAYLKDKPIWHFIGHLQTNKVKRIIGFTELIHSVDSPHLLEEIDKRAGGIGKIQRVLIEVNVSKEASKYGVLPEELFDFLKQTGNFKNVSIEGLMTMAPYTEPEKTRIYFKILKELFDNLKERDLPGVRMKYLSMGMSNDFEVAIEEGSNMVRIGTAIFQDE